MALNTYATLKTAIQDWMVRTDLSGNVADWITLAEARLNRELNPVETDATLTGTIDARTVSVSALSIVEPIALFLVDSTGNEVELTKKSLFALEDTSGVPSFWEYDPDASAGVIRFNCPLDAAYSLRFRYRQRFALSDSATTNWLLTNHPDVYLSASLVWGSGFVDAFEKAGAFKTMLEEGIASVLHIIAQGNRAELTVDPALTAVPIRGSYDGVE
jgi:hypothetical protein